MSQPDRSVKPYQGKVVEKMGEMRQKKKKKKKKNNQVDTLVLLSASHQEALGEKRSTCVTRGDRKKEGERAKKETRVLLGGVVFGKRRGGKKTT